MKNQAINLQHKFSLFNEKWQPRVVAEMNDDQFKIAKLKIDFIWHDHPDTDETFFVLEGELRIEFEDGGFTLRAGEYLSCPKACVTNPAH